MKNKTTLFAVIISLLAIGAASYLYWQNQNIIKQSAELTTSLQAEIESLKDTIQKQTVLIEEQSAEIKTLKENAVSKTSTQADLSKYTPDQQFAIQEIAKGMILLGDAKTQEDSIKLAIKYYEEVTNTSGGTNGSTSGSTSNGGSTQGNTGGNTGGNTATTPQKPSSNSYPQYVPGQDYSNRGFTYKGTRYESMKHFSKNHGWMTVEEAENATGGTVGGDYSGIIVK